MLPVKWEQKANWVDKLKYRVWPEPGKILPTPVNMMASNLTNQVQWYCKSGNVGCNR